MDSYSNNRPRFDLYEDSIKRAKEKEKQEKYQEIKTLMCKTNI